VLNLATGSKTRDLTADDSAAKFEKQITRNRALNNRFRPGVASWPNPVNAPAVVHQFA